MGILSLVLTLLDVYYVLGLKSVYDKMMETRPVDDPEDQSDGAVGYEVLNSNL